MNTRIQLPIVAVSVQDFQPGDFIIDWIIDPNCGTKPTRCWFTQFLPHPPDLNSSAYFLSFCEFLYHTPPKPPDFRTPRAIKRGVPLPPLEISISRYISPTVLAMVIPYSHLSFIPGHPVQLPF